MSYTPVYPGGWQSGESGGTPITPEALTHMERGIADAHAAVAAGYGSTMPYLNGETSNFLTLLQQEYSAMADRTTVQIVFSDSALDGSIRWLGTLWRHTEGYGVFVARSTNGVRIQRTLSSGAWGPWEYVNPPMEKGKEYRTTERWLGKPVYTQLLDLGKAYNDPGLTPGIHVVYGVTRIIRTDVVCGDLCASAMGDRLKCNVTLISGGIQFAIDADGSLVGQQMYATIYYTR